MNKILAEKIIRYESPDGIHVKAMDVGELIRCRNCKHHIPNRRWCVMSDSPVRNDDFCCWAQRKETNESNQN